MTETLQDIIMYGLAFALAITVHEFAHARAAYSAGDDTPKLQGRLSLNPLDHLDPVGTLMFVAIMLARPPFGFAWGKPVQTNPYNYKNPRRDSIRVALWGPASNIITAFVLAMALRFVPLSPDDSLTNLLDICVMFNLGIAFFNLIPVAPLDGSHILSGLLPADKARSYDLFMARYGLLILIGLIFTRAAIFMVAIPAAILYAIFMGEL